MEILFFLKLKENQKFKEKKKTSKGKVENKSSGPTFWAPKIKRRKNKKIETRPVKTSYKMAVSWLYSQYRSAA